MIKNVLGTGVDLRGEDVWRWLRDVVPALLVFGLGVLWVTWAADTKSTVGVVVAGVFLVFATVILDATLRRQRALKGPAAGALRGLLAIVQFGLGVWLVGIEDDRWNFLGVALLAFVVATVVAELRYSVRWTHTRGPVVLTVALLLIVLGLFPIATISVPAGLALAGFGVITAIVGGELQTEDWLRSVRRRSAFEMRMTGAVVLGAAGWVLFSAGSHPAYVGLLVLVALVLVATVASDSDTVELVVVLLVAVAWASAPRDAPTTTSIDPDPGAPFFVALGDSYISGEGAEHFFEGTNDKREGKNQCRRAPTAHPVLLAEQGARPAIPDRVLFLACSGAKAVDLYGPRPGRTEPVPQLEQYRNAMTRLDESDVEFVLLSLGGNDAGFGEVGQTCVGPGDCSEIGQRWVDRLVDVEARLDTAYDKLAEEVGDIPVYVVAYPTPLRSESCWWSWLNNDEHRFLSGFVGELNDVVESAAERHGFTFLRDVERAFTDENLRICDRFWPTELGMNYLAMNPTSGSLSEVVNPRNWTHNSFHPNATGHDALFRAIEKGMAGDPDEDPDPEPSAPHDVGDLDEVIPGPPVETCRSDHPPRYCAQTASEWQGSQLRSLVRLALIPLIAVIVGAWIFLMPTLRWATENRINLARPLLAVLRAAWSWLRGLVSS